MAKASSNNSSAAQAAEPIVPTAPAAWVDDAAREDTSAWDDKAGPSKQVAASEAAEGIVYETPAEGPPHRPVQFFLKRAFDIAFSGLCLLLGLPFLLLVGLAIKLDSDGPVLYRQVRVGRNGKLFEIFKFRSMVTDAERYGPRWARSEDTRVTRVGGILRRTSVDELPQILNVLSGDMSWIGPRPERPVFVARFRRQIANYDMRHSVRPGLSGWAQVNGLRGNVSIETRTEYDVHYVRRFSLWFDVVCFVRTFSAVLAGE